MWKIVKTWLPKLILAAAVAFLIINFVPPLKLFFTQDWKALLFPYTLDYGEGPLLDQTLRLAHFQNIYRNNLSLAPYTISNYPPVFPLVQVPFLWVFGPALWYGRLLSILSTLASAILIGLTLHTITRSNLASVTSGLVLLVIPYVLHWSPLNRIDNLALALSWAGLYVIVRGSTKAGIAQAQPGHERFSLKGIINDLASQPWLVSGAGLLSAAIFTRQTYALTAPLAAFVWLIHLPQRRRALYLAGLIASTSLLLVALLSLASLGGFYTNIVTANVNPFDWATVYDYARAIWNNMRFLVVGGVAFLLAGAVKPWRVRAWWLVAPYLVGAFITALTIGKVGSNVNYLLEFSAALSLVAGALIAWLDRNYWLWRSVLVVLVAAQVNTIDQWSTKEYYPRHAARMVLQATDLARLTDMIKNTAGLVLADEHMALLPMAGKNIYFQPFEFKQMQQAGLWDQQAFVQQIKQKEFNLILLYDPTGWDSQHARWTDAQLAAIFANYTRGPRLADTIIYKPDK